MAIKTPEEYLESIRDDRVIYFKGERVKNVTTHPGMRRLLNVCLADYALALNPQFRHLLVAENKEGEPVHFVFLPQRSIEDLVRRRECIQLIARICHGSPGGAKFTGVDGLNGLAVVSSRMDRTLGTNYSERVEAYRKYLQKTDAAVALAMTDVKGDRSLHPSKQQLHQDYYLRIVEKRGDGIVVKGAKVHISNAPCANEIVVLPCRAMAEEDQEYAVSFGISPNTRGIIQIPNDSTGAHSLLVFDDVFIPMERVFLAGEWEFAGELVYMFGNYHRLSADAYKYQQLEIMVGLAALLAEYNGLERYSHVRNKLAWLVMYAEAVDALGKAAAQNGVIDPESGFAYPNITYSNVAKFFFADNYYQAEKYLQDIAGGIVSTMPSFEDFANPETHHLIEKYLGGKAGIPTEDRLRAINLVRDLASSDHGNTTIHAEGSLAAQQLTLWNTADWDRFKAAAKRVAGIKTDHPDFAQLPAFPVVQL